MTSSPLISADEFRAIMDRPDVIIIDAGSGPSAYERYLKEHLPDAYYVDLNNDLAEIPSDAKNGGRHPLPTIQAFAKLLARLGIDKNSEVVVYDDQFGANAAARFWWMMQSAGFENIRLLDGGLHFAKQNNIPFSAKIPVRNPVKEMVLNDWKLPLADIQDIENFTQIEDSIIIDVREADRYNGISEPIDLVAGHIPNAINIPFKNNLNENGTFKSSEELRLLYQELLGRNSTGRTAVHCGSGVTACHTLLAIAHAGLELPKLYVGSWSEWSRNEKPIIKEHA